MIKVPIVYSIKECKLKKVNKNGLNRDEKMWGNIDYISIQMTLMNIDDHSKRKILVYERL